MKNIKNLLVKQVQKVIMTRAGITKEITFDKVVLNNISEDEIFEAIKADSKILTSEVALKEKAILERNFLSKVLKGEKVQVEKLDFGTHFIKNFQLFFFDAEENKITKVIVPISLENPGMDMDFLLDNFPSLFLKKEEEEKEGSDWCEVGGCLKVFCSHCD